MDKMTENEAYFENMPFMITAKEAAVFENEFSDFDTGAKLSQESEEQILSSVMRKAGIEMNEPKKTKYNSKKIRHTVLVIVAAAAALSAAVTAAAYGIRRSREENLTNILGNSAVGLLDEYGISNEQNASNDNYKIYFDTVISDGNYCRIPVVYEALSEEAAMREYNIPDLVCRYADTGEKISLAGSSQWSNEGIEDDVKYACMDIPLFAIDTSRQLTFSFAYYQSETNPANGIELTADVSANVETKLLRDENGRELTLSPLGLSTLAPLEEWDYFKGFHEIGQVVFTYSDGTQKSMGITGISSVGNDNEENPLYGTMYFKISLSDLLDIEDITEVRINDAVYKEVTE